MHKLYCFKEDKREFGNNLKFLMKSNNMTVESLSEEISYSINTINKWRSGERIPSLDILKDLSIKFNTTIQKLYLPNSYYEEELSEDLINVLNNRKIIKKEDQQLLKELINYNDYLSQKMMFSFLSPKEKKHLESIFNYYIITSYGKEKLNLINMTFDEFYNNFKNHIIKQYGASHPYKITKNDSIELIKEFDRIVNIKYVKEASL